MNYVLIINRPKRGRKVLGPYEHRELAEYAKQSLLDRKPKWSIEVEYLESPHVAPINEVSK